MQKFRAWKFSLVALVLVASLLAISTVVDRTPAANAAAPTALINTDTVTGSPSVEETLAIAAGFNVTTVNGVTWDLMTAAQFAAYDVLIIGDPTCATVALSATSNAATWAPVVMGTAGGHTLPGNRILIGTDPVYHRGPNPGADTLIRDGIKFAGSLAGRTGVYFDMSCVDNGQGLPTLNMLSVGSGAWTENPSPPCGGSVSLIASHPAFSSPNPVLTSADLQGWGCSVHETFPTFRSDWSALAVATDAPTMPVCGTDPGTSTTACGEPYILVAGLDVVVTAPNISVSPLTATNPEGTNHTVTATVTTTAGAPVVGQLVTFTVSGQNNGASGTCVPPACTTNGAGQVSFTYHDSNGCGDDTILASFVDPGTHTLQQASATKHWTCAPTPTPTATPGPSLGGVAEYPGGSSNGNEGVVAAAIATVFAALAGAAWYGKRRWLQ